MMDLSHLHYDTSSLRQPILHELDPNFNYDDGLNINYNNIPLFYGYRVYFSGTVVESSDEHVRLTEYENGLMNGKSLYFYANGTLGGEIIYEDSIVIRSRSWDESGALEDEE